MSFFLAIPHWPCIPHGATALGGHHLKLSLSTPKANSQATAGELPLANMLAANNYAKN